MRTNNLLVAGVVLVALCLPHPSSASCAAIEPLRPRLQHADAVFRGEVTHIGRTTSAHLLFDWTYPVTFRVLEAWKGITTTTVTVHASAHPRSAISFAPGQHFLVFAYDDSTSGQRRLTTNGCRATALVADAQADLHRLGAGNQRFQPSDDAHPLSTPALLWLLSGMLVVLAGARLVHVRRRRDS